MIPVFVREVQEMTEMESKACNHRWMVFSTALANGGCLMLECKLCKVRGTVDNPTKEEWSAAFYAPSNPYIWEGGNERINLGLSERGAQCK